MIRYALVCDRAHGFESWFPDSAAYDDQATQGFISCPECGSVKIGKAIMSPSVARQDRLPAEPPQPAAKDASPAAASPEEAPQPVALLDPRQQMLRAMMRELRSRIAENTDDVGQRFSQEARRMHDGDIPQRSIRGEASVDDARSLLEDGIDILPIPRLPEEWN